MEANTILISIAQLERQLGALSAQDGAWDQSHYQAQEYARQEKTLQELIQKEELDLRDYIRRKLGILRALSNMLSTATEARLQLEPQQPSPAGQEKREPHVTTRKAL